MTTVCQIWKTRPILCMVFNEEFDFCSQHLISSLLRNSIFLPSEVNILELSQILPNICQGAAFIQYKDVSIGILQLR